MGESSADRVLIHAASPADAPALIETIGRVDEETEFLGKPGEYRLWTPGFSERLATMVKERSGVYFIAVEDSEIVGFLGAYAGPLKGVRGSIYIPHVGLRRAWRGRGIGTRLFAAAEDWARADGAWRIELRVDEENARGLALYRKRGFVVEGTFVRAVQIDGRWHRHFFMAKPLRALAGPAWTPLELHTATTASAATETVRFRRLAAGEAGLLCRFERDLLAETAFHIKRPEEVEDEPAKRSILAENDESERWAVAAVLSGAAGDAVIGVAFAHRSMGVRLRHEAYGGINLLRSHWGRGIGRALTRQLDDWARSNGVLRLVTVVLGHNPRGLRFAQGQGWEIEARSPCSALVDGRAADRLHLAKVNKGPYATTAICEDE
jgi:RimJ/RimL family protein N-acetyltransferase